MGDYKQLCTDISRVAYFLENGSKRHQPRNLDTALTFDERPRIMEEVYSIYTAGQSNQVDGSNAAFGDVLQAHLGAAKKTRELLEGNDEGSWHWFYATKGEGKPQEKRDRVIRQPLKRIYLNPSVEHMPGVVGAVCAKMQQHAIQSYGKFTNPRETGIPTAKKFDKVILYVRDDDTEITDFVKHLPDDRFNTHAPLFTKRLAKGRGTAAQPINGDSFGEFMGNLFACALIKQYKGKKLGDVIGQVTKNPSDTLDAMLPAMQSQLNIWPYDFNA